MNEVTETPFQPAALGDLLGLWRQVMPADAPDPDRFRDIALLDRAFRPEGLVMLWRGPRLIGFGYAVAAGGRGWLVALGIADGERGHGHGGRLLRSCLAFLAAAGCATAEVGGHGERYLLPGADPVTYPAFRRLLRRNGFLCAGETFAMTRPLDATDADGADGAGRGPYTYQHPGDGDIPELLRLAAGFGPGWSGLIRAHLARGGSAENLWVAREANDPFRGGQIAGFAGFELFPGCPGRFGPMGVRPAARGGGVGGRLLRLSVASLAQRGRRSAWFLWGPDSEPGRRMYASAGFRVSRTFEFYQRDPRATPPNGK